MNIILKSVCVFYKYKKESFKTVRVNSYIKILSFDNFFLVDLKIFVGLTYYLIFFLKSNIFFRI